MVERTSRDGLAPSAGFSGFRDALGATVVELESALVEPHELDGPLAELYGAYRAELDTLGLWDRDLERRHAVERISRELAAWQGRPLFVHGFEDLTGAQWALLEALAGRAEVTVSLPYEPGRTAFAALERRAAELAALAAGHVEELPPRAGAYAEQALAHLERGLFSDASPAPVALHGALRFLEGAGSRGALELVGEAILELLRSGTPAEEVAIICPSLERSRTALETALSTLGIPFAVEGGIPLRQSAYGQALLSLLRFGWLSGGRQDLYAFLRSPYSGVQRASADYLEGRLRGVGSRCVKAATCLYTVTPDRHFEIERQDGLITVSACSGHGFKHSPAVGEELAGLV